METPQNKLKAALVAGQVQHGIWLNTGTAVAAEIAGGIGFDWCLIDGEHGPNALTELGPQLRALTATGTQAVVRIPNADVWMIKQVLDLGAQTVLVPMVDTAEEAARLAHAMRYPPDGGRGMGGALARATGYGAVTDYVHTANAQMCLMVQAESAAAIQNLDAIARTDGVDGVFIGPADLSADMGYPGQPDHPDVVKTIEDAIARIVDAGKIAGIVTFDPADVPRYEALGVTFLGVGGDVHTFRTSLAALLGAVKAS
ncbi:HpcH/HpaI aldolase/citrate lyase family protein [Yoonia sp. SS1-5]|uniref:Hydroxypyruvate/pyruvate aldolase n=1 Tax=Yoonia rhodophyticola TaxID=3137370 RepID=A0AAN0M7S3_9RHOB